MKSVVSNVWDAGDCSLQRQCLEKENISTNAVEPANAPSMAASLTIPNMSGLKPNKNEGSLHL